MPRPEKYTNQTAIYWEPSDQKDEYGREVYSDPVELKVRWTEKTEQFIDKEGETKVASHQVLVLVDVKVGGVLWLCPVTAGNAGEGLAQLTDQSNPFANDGAWKIQRFRKIPDRFVTDEGTYRDVLL